MRRRLRRAGAAPRLSVLAGAQVGANAGFYLVLPFLAAYAAGPVGLAPWAVGLVLGVRTFSQQGLFVVGGLLSDRFGARRLVVAGCAVRVVGYVALGVADSLPTLLLGAVLTGFGGALFSPALDALAAAGATGATGVTGPGTGPGTAPGHGRLGWFAALSVAAEIGAVSGPLLGALLIDRGFLAVCLLGAAVFVVLGVVLALALPPTPSGAPAVRTPIRWGAARELLAEPAFRGSTLAYAAYLVCFHQLYLALPREIERVQGRPSDIGLLFAYASVLTVVLQWPAVRLTRRWGTRTATRVGLLVIAAGFGLIAVQVPLAPGPGWVRLVPAASWVLLLVAGQALLLPSVKAAVAYGADPEQLGLRYGALATVGGIAVVVTGPVLGATLALATSPSLAAAVPWVLPALPAVGAALLLRGRAESARTGVSPAGP